MRVPFLDLAVKDHEERSQLILALEGHLRNGRLIEGDSLLSFEKLLAERIGCLHSVGVGSGTDALILAIRRAASGVPIGSKVLTSPFSWIATSTAIKLSGLVPVFCEIGEDLMLRADALPNPPTPGVVGVVFPHLHGHCGSIKEIRDYCDRYGLFLVEDCAQSFGAADESGRPVGSFGHYSCFSFNPMKSLGALGDGGAIVFNSHDDLDWFCAARHSGMARVNDNASILSHNCRLDALQASFLLIKLGRFQLKMALRSRIFERYMDGLPREIKVIKPRLNTQQSYYALQCRMQRRDEFAEYCYNKGIEVRVRHPFLISDHPIFDDSPQCFSGESARVMLREIVCLPIHDNLSLDQVDYVCAAARKFFS
jgi:dTDP-4-amino-4,6-dideoxygalactose transaminase